MPYVGKKPADIIATAIDTTTGTFSGAFTSLGIDDNADALAMTIDSDEKVLIGKTSSNLSTAGSEFASDGLVRFTRSNVNAVVNFNKKDNDGDIVSFRKDDTQIGSIGVADSGDRIYLGGGGAEGIGIDNGSNAFVPTNASGAYADNHISLGRSDARWAGVYTSDVLFVGGTGSANQLDDYEEGTWTPVLIGNSSAGSGTYTSQSARYTKIGRTVTFEFALGWSNHTGSGAMEIGGFPFNSGSQTYYVVQQEAITLTSNHVAFTARIESGSGQGVIIQCPVGGGNRAGIAIDTAGAINGSGTYQTS